MYFNSNSNSCPEKAQWDPDTVIPLRNPEKDTVTCPGVARKYHRRCQKVPAGWKVSHARGIFSELTKLNPLVAALSPRLQEAAEIMLCSWHGDQAAQVVSGWKVQLCLRAYVNIGQQQNKRPRPGPKPEPTESGFTQPRGFQRRQTSEQQAKEETNSKSGPRMADQNQQTEDAREDAKRRQERQRQEDERRQREARDREKEAREQAERAAREKDEAKKREWADAWKRYNSMWKAIEDSQTQPQQAHHTHIPWPTKSGRWEDVSEKEVRLFFESAAPVHLSSHPEEERISLYSKENMRWHTDKIMSRFGRDILVAPCGVALKVMSNLVVELRKEAKCRRKI